MYEKLQQLKWLDGMLIVGIALVAIGVGLNMKESMNKKPVNLIKANVSPIVTQGNDKVTCEVSGEVVKPGVYSLNKNERIEQALMLAGGLAAYADNEWVEKNINRAAVVRDGEKIYIPKKVQNLNSKVQSETQMTTDTKTVLGVSGGLININTASVEELDKLAGVGPSIAQKIIDYRDKNGGFKDINEIKLVSGIGDSIYEKIKDQIGI